MKWCLFALSVVFLCVAMFANASAEKERDPCVYLGSGWSTCEVDGVKCIRYYEAIDCGEN